MKPVKDGSTLTMYTLYRKAEFDKLTNNTDCSSIEDTLCGTCVNDTIIEEPSISAVELNTIDVNNKRKKNRKFIPRVIAVKGCLALPGFTNRNNMAEYYQSLMTDSNDFFNHAKDFSSDEYISMNNSNTNDLSSKSEIIIKKRERTLERPALDLLDESEFSSIRKQSSSESNSATTITNKDLPVKRAFQSKVFFAPSNTVIPIVHKPAKVEKVILNKLSSFAVKAAEIKIEKKRLKEAKAADSVVIKKSFPTPVTTETCSWIKSSTSLGDTTNASHVTTPRGDEILAKPSSVTKSILCKKISSKPISTVTPKVNKKVLKRKKGKTSLESDRLFRFHLMLNPLEADDNEGFLDMKDVVKRFNKTNRNFSNLIVKDTKEEKEMSFNSQSITISETTASLAPIIEMKNEKWGQVNHIGCVKKTSIYQRRPFYEKLRKEEEKIELGKSPLFSVGKVNVKQRT